MNNYMFKWGIKINLKQKLWLTKMVIRYGIKCHYTGKYSKLK